MTTKTNIVGVMEEKKLQTRPPSTEQPTVNIGLLGHVAHGKSTLIKALTGIATGKHHEELIRNMTIHLGFANCKIFKCQNAVCPAPFCYRSVGSGHPEWKTGNPVCRRNGCNSPMKLVRHFSLVDSPGHHDLMSTMLSGACVMNGALLVIAADDECPRPQTKEHLIAAHMMGDVAKNMIIVQNKIDLCTPEDCLKHKHAIESFVEGSDAAKAPVIPIAGNLGCNIDVLCQYICEKIPEPVHDVTSPSRMTIIRSFDINKPGKHVLSLAGAIAGGTIMQGVLHVGDTVEIRPGIIRKNDKLGTMTVTPIISTIVSLKSEDQELTVAYPGGLIAAGLSIDPSLSKQDRLVGNIMGAPGTLPPVFQSVTITYEFLRLDGDSAVTIKRGKPKTGEKLRVSIGAQTTEAVVRSVKESEDNKYKGKIKISLSKPCCADKGSSVAIFRASDDNHWRMAGQGIVKSFDVMEMVSVASATEQSITSSPETKLITEVDNKRDNSSTAATTATEAKLPSMMKPSDVSTSTSTSGSISTSSLPSSSSSVSSASSLSSPDNSSRMEPDRSVSKPDSLSQISKDSASSSLPQSTDSTSSKQSKKDRRAAVLAARAAGESASKKEAESKTSQPTVEEEERENEQFHQHRFYAKKVPAVNEVVFVKVTKIDPEIGVYYHLLAYGQLEGLAQATEISQKRLKSLRQEVTEGMEDVCVVLRSDPVRQTVDLSRKRVSPKENAECRQKFKEGKMVHSILSRTSHLLQNSGDAIPLAKLYETFGWKMYEEQESVLDLFYLSLHDEVLAFGQYNLAPKVLSALTTTIKLRLKLKPAVIRAMLEMSHFGTSGVEAIKKAVKDSVVSLGLWDNLESESSTKSKVAPTPAPSLKIKLTINTPPQYILTCTSMDKDEAQDALEKLLKTVRKSVIAAGGVCAAVGSIKMSVTGHD